MKCYCVLAFLSLASANCLDTSGNTTEVAAVSAAETSTSSIDLELDLTTSGPSKTFLDRIGLSNLQQRIEQALKATGQRWQELKPRLADLGNELKSMMTNRTAIVESIQRFANSTGILVRIRDKINEASEG